MHTLLKPLQVRADLLRRGTAVFTGQDFQRIFQVSKFKAKYFLEAYTKAGLFVRLKRGLYALQDHLPPEEEIANLLYRPSYLSFEYALAAYAILPEMVYTVTSATPKPSRTFVVEEKSFEQELKQFLPKSHWSVVRGFPETLEREIERFP